jgi:hypothetical protein
MPERAKHLFSDLALEMKKGFPTNKPSHKTLRKNYDRAGSVLSGNAELAAMAQSLLQGLRDDHRVHSGERRYYPCALKRDPSSGKFIGPIVDTHAFDASHIPSVFGFGEIPVIWAAKPK